MSLFSICEDAFKIREFIRTHSRYEFGLVSHAISKEIKSILRDFDVIVAQLEMLLEAGGLSLHKMFFYLQPSKSVLRLLASICEKVSEESGGSLLEVLHGCMLTQGDSKSRKLIETLLNQAAKPYLQILEKWIFW